MNGWVIVTDHEIFLTFISKTGDDTIYLNKSKLFNSKEEAIKFKNTLKSKSDKVMTYNDADKLNRTLQLRYS